MVPFEYTQSGPYQALVPISISSEDYNQGQEFQERGTQRLPIGYNQACAAFETPTTYDEAPKSPQRDECNKAIQVELKALQYKNTWTVEA